MSQAKKKQLTLFQSWASAERKKENSKRTGPPALNASDEIITLCDSDDEDLLRALELSLATEGGAPREIAPSVSQLMSSEITYEQPPDVPNFDLGWDDEFCDNDDDDNDERLMAEFCSAVEDSHCSVDNKRPKNDLNFSIAPTNPDEPRGGRRSDEGDPGRGGSGGCGGFDEEAGKTWIYPTNRPVRDYQFNIVQKSLFNNTLVCLPTGLGKTFVAAVVMYNFYRWYPNGKVVFMAPTKPLVAQQIRACQEVTGIPSEDTAEMTGAMQPEQRKRSWTTKRVFFLTPQVVMNDLQRGACPALEVKCLVVDEAHKALGNHSYCQVVKELFRSGTEFRIVALSATPGSDVKAVQQVLTNLMISHVEMRTEESLDVRDFTHRRSVEKVVVPVGDEINMASDLYLKVIDKIMQRLKQFGVMYQKNLKSLSMFAVLMARDSYRKNPPPGLSYAKKGIIEGDFAACMSLYHGYELLLQHGLRALLSFLRGIMGRGEPAEAEGKGRGQSNLKLRADLTKDPDFGQLFRFLEENYEPIRRADPKALTQGPSTAAKINPGHPKMKRLVDIVVNHFDTFEKDGQETRVMIFSTYRDSVDEITQLLNEQRGVKAMSFVGHSTTGGGGRGFNQKDQLTVMKRFREGRYNVLVSTCIGEEGLDIGEVDLIVCFDASKSPVRLVQRMGRTGRKRHGRVVVLVAEGKEEQIYNESQNNKNNILRLIQSGCRSRFEMSSTNPRMVPPGRDPVCQKVKVDVPFRQSQMERFCSSSSVESPKASEVVRTKVARSTKSPVVTSHMISDWRRNGLNEDGSSKFALPRRSLLCLKPTGTDDLDLPIGPKTLVLSLNKYSLPTSKTSKFGSSPGSVYGSLELDRLKEFISVMAWSTSGLYHEEMELFRDPVDLSRPLVPRPTTKRRKVENSEVDKKPRTKKKDLKAGAEAPADGGRGKRRRKKETEPMAGAVEEEEEGSDLFLLLSQTFGGTEGSKKRPKVVEKLEKEKRGRKETKERRKALIAAVDDGGGRERGRAMEDKGECADVGDEEDCLIVGVRPVDEDQGGPMTVVEAKDVTIDWQGKEDVAEVEEEEEEEEEGGSPVPEPPDPDKIPRLLSGLEEELSASPGRRLDVLRLFQGWKRGAKVRGRPLGNERDEGGGEKGRCMTENGKEEEDDINTSQRDKKVVPTTSKNPEEESRDFLADSFAVGEQPLGNEKDKGRGEEGGGMTGNGKEEDDIDTSQKDRKVVPTTSKNPEGGNQDFVADSFVIDGDSDAIPPSPPLTRGDVRVPADPDIVLPSPAKPVRPKSVSRMQSMRLGYSLQVPAPSPGFVPRPADDGSGSGREALAAHPFGGCKASESPKDPERERAGNPTAVESAYDEPNFQTFLEEFGHEFFSDDEDFFGERQKASKDEAVTSVVRREEEEEKKEGIQRHKDGEEEREAKKTELKRALADTSQVTCSQALECLQYSNFFDSDISAASERRFLRPVVADVGIPECKVKVKKEELPAEKDELPDFDIGFDFDDWSDEDFSARSPPKVPLKDEVTIPCPDDPTQGLPEGHEPEASQQPLRVRLLKKMSVSGFTTLKPLPRPEGGSDDRCPVRTRPPCQTSTPDASFKKRKKEDFSSPVDSPIACKKGQRNVIISDSDDSPALLKVPGRKARSSDLDRDDLDDFETPRKENPSKFLKKRTSSKRLDFFGGASEGGIDPGEFLDLEAEVSTGDEGASDDEEVDDDDRYEASFIDSCCNQEHQDSLDRQAFYNRLDRERWSSQAYNPHGKFKLKYPPAAGSHLDVFSGSDDEEEEDDRYEEDSFCVRESFVEYETGAAADQESEVIECTQFTQRQRTEERSRRRRRKKRKRKKRKRKDDNEDDEGGKKKKRRVILGDSTVCDETRLVLETEAPREGESGGVGVGGGKRDEAPVPKVDELLENFIGEDFFNFDDDDFFADQAGPSEVQQETRDVRQETRDVRQETKDVRAGLPTSRTMPEKVHGGGRANPNDASAALTSSSDSSFFKSPSLVSKRKEVKRICLGPRSDNNNNNGCVKKTILRDEIGNDNIGKNKNGTILKPCSNNNSNRKNNYDKNGTKPCSNNNDNSSNNNNRSNPTTTGPREVALLSLVPPVKPNVFFCSQQVSSAQGLLSSLRFDHGFDVSIRSFSECTCVISRRAAVERIHLSDFTSFQNKKKILSRLEVLESKYERVYLVIERDAVKGVGNPTAGNSLMKSKHSVNLLSSLVLSSIQILHSNTQEETATIISDIYRLESAKGHRIPFGGSSLGKVEDTLKFYLTLPGLSYIAACTLALRFRTVEDFVNSTPSTIAEAGSISAEQAVAIHGHLRHKFDPQMVSIGSKKS